MTREPHKITRKIPLLDEDGKLPQAVLPASVNAALTELAAQLAELQARVAALEARSGEPR